MQWPPDLTTPMCLEGDRALASPVRERDQLPWPCRPAREHARVAVALPGDDTAPAVAERAEDDPVAPGRASVLRRVERPSGNDRVGNGAGALFVEHGGGATAGRLVVAG